MRLIFLNTSKQFSYFLISGGISALLNIASRIVFSFFLPFELAVILAYSVGMLSAFILMRRFVFELSTNRVGAQVLRFILVNLIALIQTFAVSILLKEFILMHSPAFALAEIIAHTTGVFVPVITSYFAHKWYTFR